jgi:hypothetical protein
MKIFLTAQAVPSSNIIWQCLRLSFWCGTLKDCTMLQVSRDRHLTKIGPDDIIEEYNIPDPSLSDLGIQQCHQLNEHMRTKQPLGEKIELIVSSPFRRTLSTALISFSWLIEQGIKIIPDANWQGKYRCFIAIMSSNAYSVFSTTNFSSLINRGVQRSMRYRHQFGYHQHRVSNHRLQQRRQNLPR